MQVWLAANAVGEVVVVVVVVVKMSPCSTGRRSGTGREMIRVQVVAEVHVVFVFVIE